MATDTNGGSKQLRMYGNWARPKTAGLYGLGSAGTRILLGGLIALVVSLMVFGMLAALVVGLIIIVLMALVLWKDAHGKSRLDRLGERRANRRSKRSGSWLYRSGPLGMVPWGSAQLPGLAAHLSASEHIDSYGRKFVLIHSRHQGTYTAVIACEPDGSSLVDDEQIDIWVADWGHWLARLGTEPGVRLASATIETAPDTGHRLKHEVTQSMDQNAPKFARDVLHEVVERYPAGSNTIRAWVTITFRAAAPGTGKRRTTQEVGRDLGARLPGLTADLGATGAGATRPVDAEELCEIIRLAYNPTMALTLDEARTELEESPLRFTDVGPMAAQAEWETYRHDEAVSMSWAMSTAPRGNVPSGILSRLLAPQAEIDRKRVTLIYRPIDAARAAAMVEADLRAAEFIATSSDKPSARATDATRRAAATAAEEAAGAGLVNFGILVTATVLDGPGLQDRIDAAKASVNNLGAGARLLLRPCYAAQDSAFVAGLPLGIALGDYLAVSADFKERLA